MGSDSELLRDMMTTLAMMIATMVMMMMMVMMMTTLVMMMADRKVNWFIEHRPGAECEEIPT